MGAIRYYHWAGLDFIMDATGTPVFLEANRSTHALWEYVRLYKSCAPFAEVARIMNEANGPTCLLQRKQDSALYEENAAWIGHQLVPFLKSHVDVAYLEDNLPDEPDVLCSSGKRICPGSIFRWWYPLAWFHERSGVTVVNPNSVWLVVRDKLVSYAHLETAKHFRVPRSFAVSNVVDANRKKLEHAELFANGFVLKPRVGFGGHGVQVGNPNDVTVDFEGSHLLSERIVPELRNGCFWDVRVFVMGGRYCGGMLRINQSPVTNVFHGGTVAKLDHPLASVLEPAALEAVALLDAAADRIHRAPVPYESPLTHVNL